jgi:hypothetical protein
VRFDPFATWDTVKIYSLHDEYLGTGILHDRTSLIPPAPQPSRPKPRHSYTELLLREHKKMLAEQTSPIDYRKVVQRRPWPFHDFAKTVAQFLGRKAALADLNTSELEALKKVYNQSRSINRNMVKRAFESAFYPTVPYIVRELKHLIRKEIDDVS